MKKFAKHFMALAIAIVPCMPLYAYQGAETADSEDIDGERPFKLRGENEWKNWFLMIGGGPSVFQGDHNEDAKFGDRIYPAFDLSVGKWILPALGLRFGTTLDMVHTQFHHGMTPTDAHNAKLYPERPWLYRMRYNSWNFHGDIMFNVSSLIWKRHDRVWNLVPYVGFGGIATWHGPWDAHSWSLNGGILNSFRVCEQLDVNLEIHAMDFHDRVNTVIQGHHHDGIVNVMVGLTWHISKRGF